MNKYVEIANLIRTDIENEIYKQGEMLPFEKELCVKFECSKETIKKALNILVNEGLILRQRGKGTFVKKTCNIKNIETLNSTLYKYKNDIIIKVELLYFAVVPASKEIAMMLQLLEDEYVFSFRRLKQNQMEKNN